MVSPQQLGSKIQLARQAAELTQEQLAKKAHIAYATLTKIERGAIKNPSIYTIDAIAQALNTQVDTLLKTTSIQRRKISESDVKFVYCDINGVLVRFYQRAFVEIAEETSLPLDKIETLYMHYNDAADRGEIGLKEFDDLMGRRLKVSNFNWKKHYMNTVEPIKSMGTCLEKIAQAMPVGLISNTRETFINTLQKNKDIPDISYSAIIDSSQCGAIKPEPRIFELAEKAAHIPAKHLLLIDDSRRNLSAAEARGWHVLWFDSYHVRESVQRVYDALGISQK